MTKTQKIPVAAEYHAELCWMQKFYKVIDEDNAVVLSEMEEWHTPHAIKHKDAWGEYDEVRCVRCGELMLGSFV